MTISSSTTFYILIATMLMATWTATAATMTGTVVDQSNNAVEGATVWVNQERIVKQATTNKKGQFTIKDIVVSMTEVVVYKEGYALGGSAGPVAGDVSLTVVLGPPDLISVKVRDIHSRPIAGARVRSLLINSTLLISVEDLESHGFPALRSTDDGILVIPNLPVDGYVQLVIQHFEYADSSLRYLPVDDEQRSIILERGGRASGRITFDGQGVADARVSIFKILPQGQQEFAEILSDREGFYSTRVELGNYQVAAQHPEYASPPPVALNVVSDGASEPANLVLKAPRYIHGTVLMPDKSPCRGARLQYRADNTIFVDTTTGNDGKFTLRVSGLAGTISIDPPPGYMAAPIASVPEDLRDQTEVTINTIELRPLPEITGTVKDIDGKVPGTVLVTALNLPVPYSVLSDAEGAFSMPLNFMPAVETLHLRAEHGLRFQREEFKIDLDKAKPAKVKLSQYTPDLALRDPIPGTNNLSGLIGKAAPAFSGDTWINSDATTLSDLKGKVVVLLFWAGFDESMGPVLLREVSVLHALLKDQQDVAFLSVHDAVSSQEEIKEYIDLFNVPFPVLRDSDEQTTFATYNIVFIPQLVLIDKQGVLRYYQSEGRLLELIKGLRRE